MKRLNAYLIVIVASLILGGCKKDDKDDDKKTSGTCENKVITRNDSIIITGCSDFEPALTFSTGGYIITMSEEVYGSLTSFDIYQKNLNSYMGAKASSASSLRSDGWYSQSSIWTRIAGNWTWRAIATGSYKVTFAHLPLNVTPATLPVTYNSAGCTVLGPVHLSGSTTFTVSCPDAKLAGFTADLIDGNTGEGVLNTNYFNILDIINIDENRKQINNYNKIVTVKLTEGNYLIEVSANNEATWSIKIN